jgi:hypothetical protein
VPSYQAAQNHGRPVPGAPTPPVQKTAVAAKKSPADLAACAAIDAYKKRQLDAIEGDRRTLDALQTAIKQLGLEKQLSFMTGAQGSVGSQAENVPANVDMPPNLATLPKKN